MNAGAGFGTNFVVMAERRFELAGMAAVVRADDEGVLADAAGPWATYASAGGPAAIQLDMTLTAGFRAPATDVPHPGFAVRAIAPGKLELARFDCIGTVEDDGDIVRARFTGQPRPVVVEAAVRIAFAVALPRRGGLVLHSSGVAHGDRGLLFLGPSGAGKSTIARLAGTAPRSLGDELIVARSVGAGWRAFATPFAGENGPAERADAELAGLVFLEKAAAHRTRRLPKREALRRLLRCVVAFVVDARSAEQALAAAADLTERVPAHVLEFARRPDVADVLARL